MTLASQSIKIGAHYPIRPGGDMLEAINLWEQAYGRRMDIVNHYRKWGAPSGDFNFARISLQQACGAGRIPLITWEPCMADTRDAGPYTLEAIAAGEHDDYIREWAVGLRDLGKPVYVRFAHEMNGDWYCWAGRPSAFVVAWHRIWRLFDEADALNVKFVWCPNVSDQPKTNHMEDYWPGLVPVDVLGVDGYNNYGGWRSFDRIIRPAYDRLCALSDLPIWVCETASAEGDPNAWESTGHDSKTAWIRGLFGTANMSRVEALCYFDERGGAPQRYDWRLDSGRSAQQEWRHQTCYATGHVPAPGPYVPPVPDRVTAQYTAPGMVRVTWRTIPSFSRGCSVRATDSSGYSVAKTVDKPATSTTLGLPLGDWTVTVASWTLVRTSKPSAPVTVNVPEVF